MNNKFPDFTYLRKLSVEGFIKVLLKKRYS